MNLSPEMLDNFRDEQLGQLHELFKVTTKTEPGTFDGTTKVESDKIRQLLTTTLLCTVVKCMRCHFFSV